jgi:hypothetical protein
MSPKFVLTAAAILWPLAALTSLSGCEEKKPAAPASTGTMKTDDHGHDHGPSGEHTAAKPGHGGAVIALGEQTIGTFTAKATRDEGQIIAGKDAPIDVTITPAAGSTTQAVAVRFWIGTEDAKGSVKAKAEIEDPNDPNRWHTHAEIPNPIPPDSKLWVEVENDKGEKSVVGFELKL